MESRYFAGFGVMNGVVSRTRLVVSPLLRVRVIFPFLSLTFTLTKSDISAAAFSFSALSSFVFNVGVGNAKQTLGLVNMAENEKAAAEMLLFVNVKVKDKNGKVTLTRSNGLTTRRVRETTPFITPNPAK